MSKYYKRKKSTDINYHSLNIKVAAPAPDTTINIQEQKRKIRDDVDHISAVTQNEVRKVWAHRCRKPHIIIIDALAVMNGKVVTYQAELYQLKMTQQDTMDFEQVVKTELEKAISYNIT